MPVLQFQKLSCNAYTPTKGSDLAAGIDLYAADDYVVVAENKCVVYTDLCIQVPIGTYGRIAPRSGLAVRSFINIGAGVIDADYRGNVGVVMFNHGKTDFKVKKGVRVAQLICERIVYPELVEVKKMMRTSRDKKGFGSTD